MYFFNVFDSVIPVIMLDNFRYKPSVLLGTHTLLGKSLRLFQLLTH